MQDYDPSIGVDATSPDGRSYEAPWQAFVNDYMIRAVVVPQEADGHSLMALRVCK